MPDRTVTWRARNVLCFMLYMISCVASEKPAYKATYDLESVPQHALRRHFTGRSRWRLLPHLFISRTVSIDCNKQFKVYAATTEDELTVIYSQRAPSWCGMKLSWDMLFKAGVRTCDLTISPFSNTTIAVVPDDPVSKLRPVRPTCTFVEREELSVQLLGTGVVGVLLFFTATWCAESVAFRVSAGGLASVFLCSIVLAFFVIRHLQRVRHGGTVFSIATALAAMGISVSGLLRFWFRFPDLPELLQSRWVLAYIAASYLSGMAVTYYFDTDSGKVIDILSAAMRMLGASMVFYACSQVWEVALAAVALLTVSLLLPRRGPQLETVAATAVYKPPGVCPVAPDAERVAVHHSKRQSSVGHAHTGSTGCPAPAGQDARAGDAQQQQSDNSLSTWLRGAGARHFRALHNPPLACDRSDLVVSPLSPASSMKGSAASMHTPPVHGPRSQQSLPYSDGGPGPQHITTSAPHLNSNEDSPLLSAGLITNASTGRHIKIGGKTYEDLLEKGYRIDRSRGLMLPPIRTPDSLTMGGNHAAQPSGHTGRQRSAARNSSARRQSSAATSPY